MAPKLSDIPQKEERVPPIERLGGDERIAVPAHLTSGPREDNYVLRVVGDSMVDECVMDGDFVIVRRGATPSNGEMAVCLIGDDATLKRVFHEGEEMRLESGCPGRETMRFAARDVQIQGVVVGLMRRYRCGEPR
jgi:repressor LexA